MREIYCPPKSIDTFMIPWRDILTAKVEVGDICSSNDVIAVSYTHLDVYKRQPYDARRPPDLGAAP